MFNRFFMTRECAACDVNGTEIWWTKKTESAAFYRHKSLCEVLWVNQFYFQLVSTQCTAQFISRVHFNINTSTERSFFSQFYQRFSEFFMIFLVLLAAINLNSFPHMLTLMTKPKPARKFNLLRNSKLQSIERRRKVKTNFTLNVTSALTFTTVTKCGDESIKVFN